MQNVSTEWKQTLGCYDFADRPYIVPESYVEIKYTISDPDAQADATATDNGHMAYSNVGQTTDGLDKSFTRFATLERNMWGLDGTWGIRPNEITEDTGFVSNVLCGADCVFAVRPIITITFNSVYTTTIPGIAITWSSAYGEMAQDYIVRVYSGAALIDTISVTGNRQITSIALRDISEYDKIEDRDC
jgi:hypothetical protein